MLLTFLFSRLLIASYQVSAVQTDQPLEKRSRKKELTDVQDEDTASTDWQMPLDFVSHGLIVMKRTSLSEAASSLQHTGVLPRPAEKRATWDKCLPPQLKMDLKLHASPHGHKLNLCFGLENKKHQQNQSQGGKGNGASKKPTNPVQAAPGENNNDSR